MRIYFTLEERLRIEELLKEGKGRPEISEILSRHPKSIYNEIARRKTPEGYFGKIAHEMALKNIQKRILGAPKTFSEEETKYIKERYDLGINVRSIAAELGTCERHISLLLKSYGRVSPRPAGIGVIERLVSLEEQVKILFELIKEIKK